MDRKAWIAIILSILGLAAWQWYYVKTYSRKVAGCFAASCCRLRPRQLLRSRRLRPRREPPPLAARNQSLYSSSAEYVFSNDKGGIERAILLLHLGRE